MSKLIYQGREYTLDGDGQGLLDELSEIPAGTLGTIKTRLGGSGWITFAVGPGIPVAVIESD